MCRHSAQPVWRLKLDRVSFPNADKWERLKVCLGARGGDCGQVCVNVSAIGSDLAEFTCPYRPNDLNWATIAVLGRAPGSKSEVRIAEKQQGFGPLGVAAYCSGLRFGALDEREKTRSTRSS